MSRRSGATEKEVDAATKMQNSDSQVTATKPSDVCQGKGNDGRSARNDRAKVYGSVERQNVLILSILLASLCGCFNVITLVCSIPAVLASVRSHQATVAGNHRRARYLGNISITLMVLTLLLGAVVAIFLAAIVVGVAPLFSPCGFILHRCSKDMFGRPLQTLTCLRYPL